MHSKRPIPDATRSSARSSSSSSALPRSSSRSRWLGGCRSALAACACGLALHTASAETPPPSKEEGGRLIYMELCASCHGMQGKGKGPVASALRKPPADLTRIAARSGGIFPSEEVSAYIDGREYTMAHGPREMPVWGRSLAPHLSSEAVHEQRLERALDMLVAYLKTIQGS